VVRTSRGGADAWPEFPTAGRDSGYERFVRPFHARLAAIRM